MGKLNMPKLIVRYADFFLLALSFLMVIVIFFNYRTFRLSVVGVAASVVYIFINGDFIGRKFFREEKLRLPLGILLLVVLMGLLGWVFIVFYRLRITEVVAVLAGASLLSFLSYRFEFSLPRGLYLRKLRRKTK